MRFLSDLVRRRWMFLVSTAVCVGMVAVGSTQAAQQPLVHVKTVDLSDAFNSTSGYGDNPLAVAFDGTHAYVGGFRAAAGSAATVGVVKVENLVGAGATAVTPLPASQFDSPAGRGVDAMDFAAGSLYLIADSGAAATSFVRGLDTGGSTLWTRSPNERPMAMAFDPVGKGSGPAVAYVIQGSGFVRYVDPASGAAQGNGTSIFQGNSAYRALDIDSNGNLAASHSDRVNVGLRFGETSLRKLDGVTAGLDSVVLKNANTNLVGQGVAILEGLGSDLLAVSGRVMTQFTDLSGGTSPVSDVNVHIHNLNGSVGGLTQLTLTGDEDGIGTPWAGNVKNLSFGYDASNSQPTLLVLDFVGRRLDVYQVPEPTISLMLGAALVMLTYRRRRC